MFKNQFRYTISTVALVLLESPMDPLVLVLTGVRPLLVVMVCAPLCPFITVPEAKKFPWQHVYFTCSHRDWHTHSYSLTLERT